MAVGVCIGTPNEKPPLWETIAAENSSDGQFYSSNFKQLWALYWNVMGGEKVV